MAFLWLKCVKNDVDIDMFPLKNYQIWEFLLIFAPENKHSPHES